MRGAYARRLLRVDGFPGLSARTGRAEQWNAKASSPAGPSVGVVGGGQPPGLPFRGREGKIAGVAGGSLPPSSPLWGAEGGKV
jgi:hypothetical protein